MHDILCTWRFTGSSKKQLVSPSGGIAGEVKWPLLHGNVYRLIASFPSLHQQLSCSMGKGRGFSGRSQLLQVHPLALAYLILTGVDVKGHRLQTTDEVKVREVVVVGQTVLLAECHDRLELCKSNMSRSYSILTIKH